MSKKTFLYIRVSTLDQASGAESQARALLEWCTRNNITEYETFTDQGVSGAKESRPALDKMMERVKRLEADNVVSSKRHVYLREGNSHPRAKDFGSNRERISLSQT